jgi:aerobic carbon-monoxide dehydrogenase medium subunit
LVTALTTTLEPDELLSEIRLPLLDDGWRTGFAEFNRRAGDFALAMCAAFLRFEDGRIVVAANRRGPDRRGGVLAG